MKKLEQAMSARVAKWFLKVLPIKSAGLAEVKHTRGSNTCNLNEIKQNQTDYLESGESDHGFIHKHSDADWNTLPDFSFYKGCEDMFMIIIYPEDVIVIRHNKIVAYRETQNSLPLETAEKLHSYRVKVSEL